MKKEIKVWSLIAVIIFLTMGFASCQIFKRKIHEDGYWQYIVIGGHSEDGGEVAIVGLTESGKEQEALDVPRKIKGIKVTSFGYAGSRYKIESENLKRLYIHDNIEHIFYSSLYYFYFNNIEWECGEFPYEFKIIYSGYDEPDYVSHYYFTICIYKDLYEEIDKKYKELIGELGPGEYYVHTRLFAPANVAFMNNYSEEINKGYYRADDIENGEKITEPPVPERDGYIFTGWYTETEATNLWDFDTQVDMSDREELRLYAGWHAI